MSPTDQHLRPQLKGLEDLALITDDRAAAERMLLIVRIVTSVHDLHPVDTNNRCLRCRPPGRRMLWRRRQPCAIRAIYYGDRPHRPPNDGPQR